MRAFDFTKEKPDKSRGSGGNPLLPPPVEFRIVPDGKPDQIMYRIMPCRFGTIYYVKSGEAPMSINSNTHDQNYYTCS